MRHTRRVDHQILQDLTLLFALFLFCVKHCLLQRWYGGSANDPFFTTLLTKTTENYREILQQFEGANQDACELGKTGSTCLATRSMGEGGEQIVAHIGAQTDEDALSWASPEAVSAVLVQERARLYHGTKVTFGSNVGFLTV